MKSIDYLLRFINVLSYRLPNFLMNPKSYPFQFSHTHTVFIIFMNELLFTFRKHEAYSYSMHYGMKPTHIRCEFLMYTKKDYSGLPGKSSRIYF